MNGVRPMGVVWTPGPTGQVEPPTVQELAQGLFSRRGPTGLVMESGVALEGDWRQVMAVYRDDQGEPVGIMKVKVLKGVPELVDVAVLPEWRGRRLAYAMAIYLLAHGIDCRRCGSIYDGPLTEDGRAFRDYAVREATLEYGELT